MDKYIDKLIKGIESVTILEYNEKQFDSKRQFLSWYQDCCPYKPTVKQIELANKIKNHLGHNDIELNTMTQAYLYIDRFKNEYNNKPSVKQKYYLKLIATYLYCSSDDPYRLYESYLKFTRKQASEFIKNNIDKAKKEQEKREKELENILYKESYNYPNVNDFHIWRF